MKNEEETLDRCILSVLAVQRSRGGSEGQAAMRARYIAHRDRQARTHAQKGVQLVY